MSKNQENTAASSQQKRTDKPRDIKGTLIRLASYLKPERILILFVAIFAVL